MTWQLLLAAKSLLSALHSFRKSHQYDHQISHGGVGSGKTVLVTTGRQAKTLHTVRALKATGARVIVTDYEKISASALSLACDKFIVLPALDTDNINDWIENFRSVLIENKVDVVLPVSTINEVLFIGLAKQRICEELPHIHWICPDLEMAIQLDDRAAFSAICERFQVPVPEAGVLTSRTGIHRLANLYPHGIILKRIESSVNRKEEIITLLPDEELPTCVQPSSTDPWQWQRFIKGSEFSVWYVCLDGRVTFCGCYHSEPDLVNFDGAKVPEDLDEPLRKLISGLNLTGQFAFDFIRDGKTDLPYIIECNPRASSVLETVSKTPLWGEAFFGVDVIPRTISDPIGFLYHRNCWPWASRSEGFFHPDDPLPILGAEVAWPLNAIARKGLTPNFYQKIDVNICKIIVDGPSPARDLNFFRDEMLAKKMEIAKEATSKMDTLLLDVSIPEAYPLAKTCQANGCNVVPFEHFGSPSNVDTNDHENLIKILSGDLNDDFLTKHSCGETRLLLGENLSKKAGSTSEISYRVVTQGRTFMPAQEIPLRKIRVLHIMGSCTSEYYEGISSYYGYQCISSVGNGGRFEHVVAYVHLSGKWSIEVGKSLEYMKESAEKLSVGTAMAKLDSLKIDVALPHMFDYSGLTAYRGLCDVLRIPMIGCSGEALALSTNKARTKACAAMAGVQVPSSELLTEGEMPTMEVPFVIKPTEEDNSQGVTVIRNENEIKDALANAFKFGDEVLCEEYIELGRELRVAVIEKGDGQMEMLPAIEYFLDKESPIRTPNDKLTTNKSGQVTGLASGGRTCPANIDETLKKKLFKACITAHRALGCRDYSLFDFRIDPNGEPYMLESCLYCSFAPKSVLVSMQAAIGIEKTRLFERMVERAMTRKYVDTGFIQKFGMKQRS